MQMWCQPWLITSFTGVSAMGWRPVAAGAPRPWRTGVPSQDRGSVVPVVVPLGRGAPQASQGARGEYRGQRGDLLAAVVAARRVARPAVAVAQSPLAQGVVQHLGVGV